MSEYLGFWRHKSNPEIVVEITKVFEDESLVVGNSKAPGRSHRAKMSIDTLEFQYRRVEE